MKTYLIIGPAAKSDINQLKSEYRQNKHSLKVIGDGENRIDCSAIDIPKNAHIIINAHGINHDQHGHVIDLCIEDSSKTYLPTALAFKKIFSHYEPVNINLFSCFAGAAIKDIQDLPIGSTLTTHTATENKSLLPIDDEIMLRLSKFNLLKNNPFSVFIQTLLITPNENKFALRTKKGSEFFTSSVNDLADYSVDGIKAWQQKELLSFTNFCRLHQKKSTDLIKKKIDEFLKMVEDQSNNNWQVHDLERYQELLLFNFASWNKAADIQKLLDLKVNINSIVQQDKSTPLFVASSEGNYASAKSLIDAGAHVNILSIMGGTPIWISSQNGHDKIVKLLIDSGASIDIVNEDGYTPLFKAAQNGHYKIAKLLINAGAKTNIVSSKGHTALMTAAQEGYSKIVKLLIDAGADVNAMDIEFATSLYQAAQNGHYKITKLLINAGAKTNIASSKGVYPIHIATQNGFKEIVEALITTKNDINLKTLDDSNTALLIASSKNNFPIAKLLIDSGADVNAANIKGYTPLWAAAQDGHYEIAKQLINSGADIDAFDIMKSTPLWMAAQNGHYKVAKLLIDAGASIDAMSKGNHTALHMASQNGHYKVIKLLIDEGADINAVTESGYTALHKAVKNNFKDIIGMLIKTGIQVNSKADEDITPIMIACNNDNLPISKLLLAAGVNTQEKHINGYIAYNFADSQAIKKEIKLYEKDPITYILKNNKQSQYAINALHNLKASSLIEEKKDNFTKVEECLEFQMKFQDLNLNKLCGIDGSYYDDYDL